MRRSGHQAYWIDANSSFVSRVGCNSIGETKWLLHQKVGWKFGAVHFIADEKRTDSYFRYWLAIEAIIKERILVDDRKLLTTLRLFLSWANCEDDDEKWYVDRKLRWRKRYSDLNSAHPRAHITFLTSPSSWSYIFNLQCAARREGRLAPRHGGAWGDEIWAGSQDERERNLPLSSTKQTNRCVM